MHTRCVISVASFLLLCSHVSAQGQTPASPEKSLVLGETSGAFIALSVADLTRMVQWYRDTLGFRVHSEHAPADRPVRATLLRQGNAFIEMVQLPDAKPISERSPGTTVFMVHGFFKSGFVLQDIDAAYQTLRSRGVRMAYELGQPPGGPYRSFGIRDPEGNLLQFFGR